MEYVSQEELDTILKYTQSDPIKFPFEPEQIEEWYVAFEKLYINAIDKLRLNNKKYEQYYWKKTFPLTLYLLKKLEPFLVDITEKSGWLAKYALRTQKTYIEVLTNFFTKNKIESLDDLIKTNKYSVKTYIDDLIQLGASPKTIEKNISILSSLYSYLINKNILEGSNPADEVKKPKVDRDTRPPVLPDDYVKKILNSPDVTDLKGRRDKAVIALMFYAGYSPDEVCNLKIDDLHHNARGVLVIKKTIEEIFVDQELEDILMAYINMVGHGKEKKAPLILGLQGHRKSMEKKQIERIFKEHVENAGLSTKITPQIARATFLNQKKIKELLARVS